MIPPETPRGRAPSPERQPNSDDDHHPSGQDPHLLREIMRVHQMLMSGFSRKVGVPPATFALMRLLVPSGKGVGIMTLARQLGINAAAVTRQVNELERKGMVQRHADPNDGRRCYVQLSPSGLKSFKEIHKRGHELERAMSSTIGADEMAIAVSVIQRVRKFIEGAMADEIDAG